MILVVSRIVIFAVSAIVPGGARADWRDAWLSELRHYTNLLRTRRVKSRYVRARIWHHLMGAIRDAWQLFSDTPAVRELNLEVRTPGFCLGLIALGFAGVVSASHGLAITRAMLAPPYPEAGRLVLISEGGAVPGERHPIPPALLEFWKAHCTALAGLAGYQWDSHGTVLVTPGFFDVLGAQPRWFMLRRVRAWRQVANRGDLAVLGRLKPGVTPEAAQSELRDLAAGYRHYRRSSLSEQAQVMPLVTRMRRPFWAYAVVCSITGALLLAAACIGMRTDRRRIGRIRGKYWAYFCAKSVSLPVALALVIWEFTRATSFTVTGGSRFVAEPFFVWLVILACGAIVWWCLLDQWARCRACLRILQYPVRIGSMGAVLFDHAGTELMCCEGHGALYVPAVSSDYVQRGGWTAMDAEDISSEAVPR
jgi:hypothetical protein